MNKKELTAIILSTIILAFSFTLINLFENILLYSLIFVLVILINTFGKKLIGEFANLSTEVKLWEMRRYGLFGLFTKLGHPQKDFKKPLPLGVLIPPITAILTLGYIPFLAGLTFEVKPMPAYSARGREAFSKKRGGGTGLYRFSEATEWHIGLIAVGGILANLIFALLGYLINQPEFATINLSYAFFNLIPISELDGTKIYMGSSLVWVILAIITTISVAMTFLVL